METELELMSRIKRVWGERIAAACAPSSPLPSQNPEARMIPSPAFLAALISLESSGQRYAQRFEPAVWKHLHDVAVGKALEYGSVKREGIDREMRDIAKTADYHRLHMDAGWAERHASILADGGDAAIRQMATSFGLCQIMGYHTLDWPDWTPLDLLSGQMNLNAAVKLLGWFVEHWHLDPMRQTAELFRCWNTGSPDPSHATFDPRYIENGLRRMEVYNRLTLAPPVA